jgi:hypothetical protein
MAEYVNRGTDPRAGGVVGQVLATTQRALSVQTPTPPKTATILPLKRGAGVTVSWPPFLSVFIPKANGRYWSFRAGWRWDANWGNGNNAYEPKVDEPGGYIADVIIKTDIDHVVRN